MVFGCFKGGTVSGGRLWIIRCVSLGPRWCLLVCILVCVCVFYVSPKPKNPKPCIVCYREGVAAVQCFYQCTVDYRWVVRVWYGCGFGLTVSLSRVAEDYS